MPDFEISLGPDPLTKIAATTNFHTSASFGCHSVGIFNLTAQLYTQRREGPTWVDSSKEVGAYLKSKYGFDGPINPFFAPGLDPCLVEDIRKQIYKQVAVVMSKGYSLYIMSDNVAKEHVYGAWASISGYVRYLMEQGWGCTATPMMNNPMHHRTDTPTCVQGYMLVPLLRKNLVAMGTEFSKYDGYATLQDFADMHAKKLHDCGGKKSTLESRFKGAITAFDKLLGRKLEVKYEPIEVEQTGLKWKTK